MKVHTLWFGFLLNYSLIGLGEVGSLRAPFRSTNNTKNRRSTTITCPRRIVDISEIYCMSSTWNKQLKVHPLSQAARLCSIRHRCATVYKCHVGYKSRTFQSTRLLRFVRILWLNNTGSQDNICSLCCNPWVIVCRQSWETGGLERTVGFTKVFWMQQWYAMLP